MISDYPDAQFIAAHSTNYAVGHKRTIDQIVIHATDGHGDAEGVAHMWARPHHGSSAHFVAGQAGEIIQCVALEHIAWHAHAANSRSIGIEHCIRSPRVLRRDDPGMPPTQVQYESSARLVAWLCAHLGIPPDREHILGHAEADRKTTHRGCPTAAGWDWDVYMPLIADRYGDLAEI